MNAAVNAQPLQRDQSWHAARIGKVTASRVGAILGFGKYAKRSDVLREMVEDALSPEPIDRSNPAMQWGSDHEADALNAYEQRFAMMIEPCGAIVHPEYSWIAASPDGFVGEHGSVEAKCPYRAKYTEPDAEYVAQMQLQMACTGRDWTDFVVWRPNEPLHVTRVDADRGWLARVLPQLEAFMRDYEAALAAGRAPSKERDDAEWRDAVDEWRCAQAAAVSAAELEKAARERLIALAPQGAKGCGVQVVRVERAGTIRYADAIKSMLPDVDLSPWRGKPSVSYQVRESKE